MHRRIVSFDVDRIEDVGRSDVGRDVALAGYKKGFEPIVGGY